MKAAEPLLSVVAIATGLLVIEAVAWMIEPAPRALTLTGLMVRDETLGWRLGSAGVYEDEVTSNGKLIYNVRYTIDENNQRITSSRSSGDPIVFIGDSFTFGLGVNDADTMPQAFSDLTRHQFRVINLGVPAYSPQQFLRAMETGQYDKSVGPHPALFVFLTAPWQSDRVACKASYVIGAPRYVLDSLGVPKYIGSCGNNSGFSNTALYRVFIAPLLNIASSYDRHLYEAEIARAAALAKRRYNVTTIVLFLSGSARDDRIMKQLRSAGLMVLDASLVRHASKDARISIPGDGHPTPLAHRLRAAILQEYLNAHMAALNQVETK